MAHNVQRSYLSPHREERLDLARQLDKSPQQVLEEHLIRGRGMSLLADGKISRAAIRVFNYLIAAISVEDQVTDIRPRDIATGTTMSLTSVREALYELQEVYLIELLGVRVKVNAVHTHS